MAIEINRIKCEYPPSFEAKDIPRTESFAIKSIVREKNKLIVSLDGVAKEVFEAYADYVTIASFPATRHLFLCCKKSDAIKTSQFVVDLSRINGRPDDWFKHPINIQIYAAFDGEIHNLAFVPGSWSKASK